MRSLLMCVFCLFAFVSQGQIISTIAGKGVAGYTGDGASCKTAELYGATQVIFDKHGNMYICDGVNNVIRMIDVHGIITTVAGNGTAVYSGDNGPALAAGLYGPTSIALDTSGNLYISTSGDSRIRKVKTNGNIVTVAGTGTGGYNGDDIHAATAQLYNPYLGAFDKYGNLYFGDHDNYRVRKITPAGIITTIAGDGTITDGADGMPATATGVGSPGWMTVDAYGDVYIPDNTFGKIRTVDITGNLTTIAGGGMGGTSGQATDAVLSQPNGVTLDKAGNIYIADYGAHVVRMINTAGIITTLGGTGVTGYSGDGGAATLAKMTPNTVTIDKYGNVYIADMDNNRIRRITYNTVAVNEVNNTTPQVSIYPNPAHEELTINGGAAMEHVRVLNAIGQVVVEQSTNEHEVTLNVRDLRAGVYFVRVGGVYVGRFLKE